MGRPNCIFFHFDQCGEKGAFTPRMGPHRRADWGPLWKEQSGENEQKDLSGRILPNPGTKGWGCNGRYICLEMVMEGCLVDLRFYSLHFHVCTALESLIHEGKKGSLHT